MHSYVTLGNDAPRGVRKRGLSKGKAGSVREQVESWKVRGKVGRVGNLAKSRGSLWMVWYGMVVVDFCALGGRCARGHWHTGKRKGEGEGGKAKILGFGPWSLVLLQDPAARRATLVDRLRDGQDDEQGHAVESWQNGTILARILDHLWTGLVNRRAFFERKFGAVFEHAKATI